MNRRDFLNNFRNKATQTAAVLASPAIIHATNYSNTLKQITDGFSHNLESTKVSIEKNYSRLNNRIDAAALSTAYQQVQLYFIFLLLVISFALDGGIMMLLIAG